MMLKHVGLPAAFAVLLSAGAFAAAPAAGPAKAPVQLPPQFGAPGPQACSPQYQRFLKLQVEAFRQLRRLSRGEGGKLCTAIESADAQGVDKVLDLKGLDRLLTPDQRDALGAFGFDLSRVDVPRIMRHLGVDLSRIDLRKVKEQCRQAQGDVDRFATEELARLENETLRCDDRI
jgi:hypothetical protein